MSEVEAGVGKETYRERLGGVGEGDGTLGRRVGDAMEVRAQSDAGNTGGRPCRNVEAGAGEPEGERHEREADEEELATTESITEGKVNTPQRR